MILHIPHHSTYIPEEYRYLFVISDETLAEEIQLMTDHDTDKMFGLEHPNITRVTAEVSRLLVDMERFRDDKDESMSKKGMGAVYTQRQDGTPLKVFTPEQREALLQRYYDPHHKALEEAVQKELDAHGECLIIDCHSFPNEPLPYETTQDERNIDFCLGFDGVHCPTEVIIDVCAYLDQHGFSYRCNYPFAGSIVPTKFYGNDPRVKSLMIEVNRDLDVEEVKWHMDRLLPYLAGDTSAVLQNDFAAENIIRISRLGDWHFEEGEIYLEELDDTPDDFGDAHDKCWYKSMEVMFSSPSCLTEIKLWMEVVFIFDEDKALQAIDADMIGTFIDRIYEDEVVLDGNIYFFDGNEAYTDYLGMDEGETLKEKLIQMVREHYQLILHNDELKQKIEMQFISNLNTNDL